MQLSDVEAAVKELVFFALVNRGFWLARRGMLTVSIPTTDAMCDELRRRGVELLNGPIDRPWGVRTASFADPAGHVWELAQPIR